jgi:dienelactone hydrolase
MRRGLVGVAGLWLAAVVGCSGGSSHATAQSSESAGCSPFGNPPRPVTAEQVPGSSIPLCLLGRRLGPWQDADGHDRYACLYEPSNASQAAPLPLVVYVHPSLFTADTLETATNLLALQNVTQVGDDPSHLGFILLAPQGRLTKHFYPSPDDQGLGWDNWYRQLDPGGDAFASGVIYPENVDAATIDHFIDGEIATGKVDENRLYVTGWSNGAAMSILYGLSRPNVAAIAPYSAPDPLHAFNDPCPQTAVARAPDGNAEVRIFNAGLPVYHVHNDCDIAGLCPNGERMAGALRSQGVTVDDFLIDSLMLPATACLDVCGTDPNASSDLGTNPAGITLGTINHTRWPQVWTLSMLDFFRTHPRNARP